jgi:hypothetical protein
MFPPFAILLYGLLILAVAGLLRRWKDYVAHPLYWLHGLTVGLVAFPAAVYLFTGSSVSYQALPFFWAFLVSTGLLAGVRRRLQVTVFPRLLLGHTLLVGLCCPLVVIGQHDNWARDAIQYQNAAFTVAVVGHLYRHEYAFKPADEQGATDVNLYETVLGFDHYLGTIEFVQGTTNTQVADKIVWQQVTALTYDATSRLGNIQLPAPALPVQFALRGPSSPPEGYSE